MSVNLIGVLGPELGFDALWYHLTLPKLYLLHHKIYFIPGGLLYYSVMPKLTEMLYVAALLFSNEIGAKLIHFFFGVLTSIAIYSFSKKYTSQKYAFLASLLFYSNLVVAWESITAYIDLARTFFETLALYGFVRFVEFKKRKWLFLSAAMVGFAISVKILAFGSLFIFTILLFMYKKEKLYKSTITSVLVYWLISNLVVAPWLLFSFVSTGNPFYPFFTNVYKANLDIHLLNPLQFILDVGELFLRSADPISPFYAIILPLLIVFYKKFDRATKIITIYSFLAIVVWYFTPRTGGGRFMLPYLPAFSILSAIAIKNAEHVKVLHKFLMILVIFIAFISIGYRFIANAKYLPVIFGKETKEHFLANHLSFSYGDFYDTDGFFKKKIMSNDNVLLYGFHNLYYVNFPFIDSSWVKKGDSFSYIATQNTNLPKRFDSFKKIYDNSKTKVSVYSDNRKIWRY